MGMKYRFELVLSTTSKGPVLCNEDRSSSKLLIIRQVKYHDRTLLGLSEDYQAERSS